LRGAGGAAAAARLALLVRDHSVAGRLWRPGPNDAADVVALRRGPRGVDQALVIARHTDSGAEAGRFALPGGFVNAGETAVQAAVRELAEETGLAVDPAALVEVGVVEGGGRDPRDTPERWVRSTVFGCRLPAGPSTIVRGGSDAARAFFVDVDRLPGPLAFDHDALLARARTTLDNN
jgi:ADP-ribose pyrophosphatase YjhB (NUDIX family)